MGASPGDRKSTSINIIGMAAWYSRPDLQPMAIRAAGCRWMHHELLIRRAALGGVAGENIGTSEAKMGQRTERKIPHDASVVEKLLELSRGRFVTLEGSARLERNLAGNPKRGSTRQAEWVQPLHLPSAFRKETILAPAAREPLWGGTSWWQGAITVWRTPVMSSDLQ